ncbi:hypothetical protein EV714DRAFT_278347 [Schizophyllum commune]
MGYLPSLPPPDSDTPPYTQRHTPAPVLASPAPSPRSAVPMASSERPPVVPGCVSSPLALSPPSSQQSPRPESNSGSSYRAGGSERMPVRRPYHPNPPAHRSEWVVWPSPEFVLDETAPLKAQRNAPASATTTDASVRAPGEREQFEPSKPSIPSRTDSGREETWGESFKVEWFCTKRLPFFCTRHLRNSGITIGR